MTFWGQKGSVWTEEWKHLCVCGKWTSVTVDATCTVKGIERGLKDDENIYFGVGKF